MSMIAAAVLAFFGAEPGIPPLSFTQPPAARSTEATPDRGPAARHAPCRRSRPCRKLPR